MKAPGWELLVVHEAISVTEGVFAEAEAEATRRFRFARCAKSRGESTCLNRVKGDMRSQYKG